MLLTLSEIANYEKGLSIAEKIECED